MMLQRRDAATAMLTTAIVLLFCTHSAEAQSTSSGTLVAAAMETAGYRAQEIVLRDLSVMLERVGALVYACCVFSAILTIALMGKYRPAAYLLIGPSMFLYVINHRTLAAGAEWQYRIETRNSTELQNLIGPTANSNVSWAFHEFNLLISSIYENLISLYSNESHIEQLKFMTRQQVMDELLGANVDNPGFMATTWWTMKECSQEMYSARMYALGIRDPSFVNTVEYRNSAVAHLNSWKKQDKSIPMPGPVYNYFSNWFGLQDVSQTANGFMSMWFERINGIVNFQTKTWFSCYDDILTRIKGSSTPTTAAEWQPLLRQFLAAGKVSCEEMWCLLGMGAFEEAKKTWERTIDNHAKGLPQNEEDQFWQELAFEIVQKMTAPTLEDENGAPMVPQLNGDPTAIPVILVGHLLRKAVQSDPRIQSFQSVGEHTKIKYEPLQFTQNLSRDQSRELVQKYQQDLLAKSKKYEVYVLAMTLPYIQGVLLFGLAMSFPFFAVTLVMPGQAGGLFTWMTLWAWLKSWDVGFAIAMSVDEILWNLMPHNSTVAIRHDPNMAPVSIFEAAFQDDPMYSLSGYYVVMGTVVSSIPLITAKVVLGSKAAVANTIMGGISRMGERLGGSAADYASHFQLNDVNYMRDAHLVNSAMKNVNSAATGKLQQLSDQAKAAQEEAEGWSFWGVVGGIAAGVAAAAVVVITAPVSVPALLVGGAAVVAGTATGVGVAAAGNKASIKLDREGNKQMAAFIRNNAKMHYYNAGKSEQFLNLDAVRGGISLRQEHWNQPGAVTSLNADVDKIIQQSKQEMSSIRWEGGTGMIAEAATGIAGAGMFGSALGGGAQVARLAAAGVGTSAVGMAASPVVSTVGGWMLD